VTIAPLPYDVPGFAIGLLYARRATSNAAVRLLADLIIRACDPPRIRISEGQLIFVRRRIFVLQRALLEERAAKLSTDAALVPDR
jgi:hypothetical protein